MIKMMRMIKMSKPTDDELYLCFMAWMLGPEKISDTERYNIAELYARGHSEFVVDGWLEYTNRSEWTAGSKPEFRLSQKAKDFIRERNEV
jgi:hypothetical protein